MKIIKFTEKLFTFKFSTNLNTAIPSKEVKQNSKIKYIIFISDFICLKNLVS